MITARWNLPLSSLEYPAPRPQHEESDEAEQAAVKKRPEEVDKLQPAYPEAKGELWSQDEHRIGLKPILRRVWGSLGSRIRTVVRARCQWMDLYGFVQPHSGATSWLLMPTVNTTPVLWRSRLSHRNKGWDHTSTFS